MVLPLEQLVGTSVLVLMICSGNFAAVSPPRVTSACATGPHRNESSTNETQSYAAEPFEALTVGRLSDATADWSTRSPVEPVSTSRPFTVTQFVVLPGAQIVALANAPLG